MFGKEQLLMSREVSEIRCYYQVTIECISNESFELVAIGYVCWGQFNAFSILLKNVLIFRIENLS